MNIGGFLSNDSLFGRLMTKLGTIVVLNILFAISCIPFLTVGPALSALYYSVCELMREEENDKLYQSGGTINPIKVYWKGIRRGFARSMICWLLFVSVMILGTINLQICATWQGIMRYLSSIVAAVMLTAYAGFVLVFPVLANTDAGIKDAIRMAFQMAFLSPLRALAAVFLYTLPLILIRLDTVNEPLYAFVFSFFGCGALALITARILKDPLDRVLSLKPVGKGRKDDDE